MSQPAYTTESQQLTPAQRRAAVSAAKPAKPGKPAKPAAYGAAPPGRETTTVQSGTVLTDPRLPGVELSLEMITPSLAEHYLAKLPTSQSTIQQRSLSDKTVDRYAGDMAGEEWPFTGDPIRFNTLGELVDGQHRLRAVMQSGTSEIMVVIRGLDPETFVVFDTGRARSFTDHLRSLGVANVSMAAGLTRRIFHWKRGNYGVANVARIPNARFVGVPASPGKLLETFREMRQEITAAGRRGAALRTQFASKTAAPAVIAFVYLIFSRIDLERCEMFFHELQIGPAQIGPEYPMAVLRDRLMKEVPKHTSGLPDWVWIHFFFHTWNKWYAGETMGPLRAPSSQAFNYLAKPADPHEDARPEGWEPLGGVTA
jgi:hypothetical protein